MGKSVLSPESWPFSLVWLPLDACMVGGAVRDALLNRRREYLDLDFVLAENAVKTARAIANHYKAGFVLLDAERQIARVVFKNATADFAQQEGETLETDLHRRDFTINAIAYNPHSQVFIDPLQGRTDLAAGIIRMVSRANLQDDPLRLLRGYRQASQLGFTITAETRQTMAELAPLLSQIAAERVKVELDYLLTSPQGTPWLKAAWEDGLLRWILHDELKSQNLDWVAAVDLNSAVLGETWAGIPAALAAPIPGLAGGKGNWNAIAKLACLILSPFDSTNPKSQIPNLKSFASVEDFLRALKYSVPEIRGVTTILKCLPQLQVSPMSVRNEYFLFRDAGVAFPALAVVATAIGISRETIAPLINRYFNLDDQVAHPTPLVTGKELIQALNLSAGPKIGWLLIEIAIARCEGKIFSGDDAIAFASQLDLTNIKDL
jgi:tRNA nucleotidyltransferase (CCA-adding enzyme)